MIVGIDLARPPGRRLGPLVALAVCLACGLPLVGRGFTSEDFLLLRVLRDHPPWGDWGALVAGPWLGIEVVRFYRPVAQLLLAVEAHLFSAHAWLYGLVHLAVHAGNVLWVHRLARQLAPPPPGGGGERARWGPLAAALLFAVHPLSPNAVAWIASYATLFATAFALAAVSLWLAWRRSGGARRWAAAFAAFAAALGSYEAAAVVPLLLAAAELLPLAGDRRRTWPARALALAPFFAAVGGYLLLRRVIFGAVVGGYASFANRLAPAEWPRLAADAARCLFRTLHPIYAGPFDGAGPAWAPLAVILWAVVPASLLVALGGATGDALRRWAFAWTWALVAFLPFAFQPFVPANGRYAYFAVAGLALGCGGLLTAPGAAARPRPAVLAAATLVAALGVQWLVVLPANVAAHRRAGAEARTVAARLAEAAAAAAPGPLFVGDVPLFVRDAGGTPLAQVLRYGLSDSLRPPFRELPATTPVYPLAGVSARVLAALADAGEVRAIAWDAELGRFLPLEPAPLLLVAAELDGRRVRWRPLAAADGYRLVVATEGNPAFVEAAAGETDAGLPADFVRSMRTLYDSPVWWWVEARQGGETIAVSRPQRLP